jgi:hypothetical protein
MRKLAIFALLSVLLVSCHATARFYPVQGPLMVQTPPPVFVGKISGALYSGNMTVTGDKGEFFTGRWEAVKRPEKSTDAPNVVPRDEEMAPLWDSIYGNGFYVAHVLGTRLYARASLKSKSGDSLKVEFYRPEGNSKGDIEPLAASIKGVAKDDKGNVYKITFS